MDEKWASITALITAYCRGYHATHDAPKIFDDFVAAELFTTEEHVAFDRQLASTLNLINPERAATNPDQATALAIVMQTHNGPITLSRSRYTEDRLLAALSTGAAPEQTAQQYVILGAGFDTFAFRRPELLNRLEVFEVDHPATQAIKQQRLAMLDRPVPPQLHFAPIDFATQSLSDVLRQTSYDVHRKSFFSWLGVTYYLTREVVLETLREVAASATAGSEIVFDYMEADAFVPERAARRIQLMQTIARQVGEPMQSGFDPRALAAELDRVGFQLAEDLDPAAIEARYFPNRSDEYHAFEQVHFARAMIA
ncbi:MAG TPA: SAM-dependent methyltransferase [Anaerolineae bacterium]|nr:SAM-dependent methyltransferase [Anaerolineae bacterium]